MRFIISGQTIEINSLASDLDKSFISLHEAYFAQGTVNWDEFESAAQAFFDSHPDPKQSSHDDYFNNFTIVWRRFMAARNYDEAERIWQMALSPALSWEVENKGQRIHKGTPYYFWGWTALQRGDLDKAYALMHLAANEDIQTSGQKYPDTPAYAFASLNYEKAFQAFGGDWLVNQMRFLDSRQNQYSATYNRPFKLDDFKSKFLQTPPSVDIGFLFTYTVARLMRLLEVPAPALLTSFASQLEANILFDLALVIDGSIGAKNAGKWGFIHHAEFLLGAVGQPLSEAQLGEINQAFNADFDKALGDILDGQFKLSDNTPLSTAQRDVALAYGMRNRGAHDVSAAPTVWNRFEEIEQALFSVLYMSVDYLH